MEIKQLFANILITAITTAYDIYKYTDRIDSRYMETNDDYYDNEYDDDRVLGGQKASIEEFPFMVSLWYIIPFDKHNALLQRHFCGATIVRDYWILTAAHCVNPVFHLLIQANNAYIRTRSNAANNRIPGYSLRRIVFAVVHPRYNHGKPSSQCDLALLKVNRRFGGLYEQPINLPGNDFREPTTGIVVGWGRSSTSHSKLPEILRYAEVIVHSQGYCKRVTMNKNINDYNTKTMLCAGHEKKDVGTCKGDSGGPLLLTINGSLVQIGITSWGFPPCSIKGLPGFYTKVSTYLKWIKVRLSRRYQYTERKQFRQSTAKKKSTVLRPRIVVDNDTF